MAGILDYIFGREQEAPAGILNQQAPPDPSYINRVQAPGMGGLRDFVQSDAYNQMAIGLMSGRDNMDSLARGYAGYTDAKKADKEKLAQGDQYVRQATAAADQRKAMNDYLKGVSGISPEQQAYLASDPEAGRAMALESLKPKEYKAPETREVYDEATGRAVKEQWNKGTATWERAGGVKAEPAANPNQQFDNVSGLRKEVQALPSYKNYAQAAPIYDSMVTTAGNNTKASDLNLVYGLGKIMDPGSVVREGEQVMVRNTAAWPDWLKGAYSQLQGGAALDKTTRESILSEAYIRANSYQQAFEKDVAQYRGISDRYGINQADVIPTVNQVKPYAPQQVQAPTPLPGGVDEDWDIGPNGVPVRLR